MSRVYKQKPGPTANKAETPAKETKTPKKPAATDKKDSGGE